MRWLDGVTESMDVSLSELRAGGSNGKEAACKAMRPGFNLWVKKIPGGGNGNPLPYFHLGKSTDRGAWLATVHGVTESRTRPSTQ